MMTEDDRLRVRLISLLLSYPGTEGWRRVQEYAPLIRELDATLDAAYRALIAIPRWDLEQLYVLSFDFDAQCSLNVTDHELGDSRNRGAALLELRGFYRQAGWDIPGDQIPDFLPMLLELVAVAPEVVPKAVMKRIAAVSAGIAQRLGEQHPYAALLTLVPKALGLPSIEALGDVVENPDLESLPYPSPIEYHQG